MIGLLSVGKHRKMLLQNNKNLLLICDSARCNLTDASKAAIKTHSKMAVIPGGLTKVLQPLDFFVNKSFK